MTAFDQAALRYLDLGWLPVPVRGKTVPAKGATGYDGTVTPAKVQARLDEDPLVRARAGRGVGLDNAGLRHHLTLSMDIDDGYGDKDGVSRIAQYAEKRKLSPLPPTWSSTARGDDSPSRQYIYRIPADERFQTKPCVAVELCTWHHRFTVCAPTIHPATGTPYRWYRPGEAGIPPTWGEPTDAWPVPDNLADLPAEWLIALRGGVANADRTAAVVDLPELFATFAPGDPDGLVRYLIGQWSDPSIHVGHDEAKNALIHAFLLGREGRPGIPQLYSLLLDRFSSYLAAARPDVAHDEVTRLVDACATIAQQKPLQARVQAVPAALPVAPRLRAPRPVGFRPGLGDLDPTVAAALDVGLARRAEAAR